MYYKKYNWLIICALSITPVLVQAKNDNATVMDIYGHVMLDMGFQSGSNDSNWYDVVRPSKLPVYDNQYGKDGNFYASVRQTRLGFKTTTPVKNDTIKTIFEFELFGVGSDEGQTTFRLRHAYGEYKQLGAGQTWSVFMDPDVFPDSIEYWGPNGMVFYRNIQLRYTPMTGTNSVAIAFEQPGGSGDPGVLADDPRITDFKARWPLPDLSAQYRRTGSWGHFQVAGILRAIEVDDLGTDPVDNSQSFTGWGINLSSNIKFSDDTLKLQVVYGEGITNYLNDATSDIGALQVGNPDLAETLPLLGIVAFFDRTWNKRFTSTFGYSYQDIDNSIGQTASAFRTGQYALANLLYHPIKNITWGVELQWAKRENKGDGLTDKINTVTRLIKSSDDVRLQFSFKYNFGKTFGS
ncbi:MAG: DcaP family trimeric outer membrane transporter [Thiohalomonadales bacterium]